MNQKGLFIKLGLFGDYFALIQVFFLHQFSNGIFSKWIFHITAILSTHFSQALFAFLVSNLVCCIRYDSFMQ